MLFLDEYPKTGELHLKRIFIPPGDFSLQDAEQTWAGIGSRHDGLEHAPGETVELVDIAKGLCRKAPTEWHMEDYVLPAKEPKVEERFDFYHVMCIGWDKGSAFRKGLGRVPKQIWEKQRGECFTLMLG